MKDTTFFSLILGLPRPWDVAEVVPNLTERTLLLRLRGQRPEDLTCPECSRPLVVHGHSEARRRCPWDVLQLETTLVFETPRVSCRVHGSIDSARIAGGTAAAEIADRLCREPRPSLAAVRTSPPSEGDPPADSLRESWG